MKLLLDENLPKRFKNDFSEHEIYHVTDLGWNGIKNGKLLQLMLTNNFEVLFTFDKYPISVFVLIAPNNEYRFLLPLVPRIKICLENPEIGLTIITT